jgi:outer membrane protein TolC
LIYEQDIRVTRPLSVFAATLALIAAHGRRAPAQLTLADALREADRGAFVNRVAAGNASAQNAQRLAPLSGILPTVRLEAGYLTTNDPIGVFGSTLRQRAITTANFDPERLNHPANVGNYQGAVVVEQPLFNADAWTGRRTATFAAKASRATEEWTRLSTRADVIRAYFATGLASERVTTIEAASRAAHAHQSQAEAMVRQGVATRSDALLAAVRAGEIDAQLVEATGAVQTARHQLAVLLGRGSDREQDLGSPRPLPSADNIRLAVARDTTAQAPQPRADLDAANYGLDAAHADEARARSAFLPRLNAFARYDWNSPARLYAGDRNWTAGVMASWNLFTGARDIGDVRAAAARASTAVAQSEAATANARLEVEQTRVALAVALVRLNLAENGMSQSAEAHRIVAKKYEGGLATVVELLDAHATEIQSSLALLQSRWTAIAADAERLRALGRDPGALVVLDRNSNVAASDQRFVGQPHDSLTTNKH